MKTTYKFPEGLTISHNGEGHIKVTSQILKDEPIYNEVTLDTALRNQLKNQLINLQPKSNVIGGVDFSNIINQLNQI